MRGQEKKTDQGLRVQGDTQKEAETEALLARTLVSRPPPESLRRQVRQRVAEAWDRRPLSLQQRLEGWFRAPSYRWAWGAVAALALIAVGAALIAPANMPVAGTAIGEAGTVVLIVILVGIVLLVLGRFLFRR
jgi:hypothetical protein